MTGHVLLKHVLRDSRHIFNKLSWRSLLRATNSRGLSVTSISNEKHIFKSPHSEVEIPNVSLTEYLRDMTLPYDDRVALISAETGEQLRFGEVWERVRAVASALSRLGLTKGSTMALISPNCPEFVISFIAAVSVGATVTTVNCLYTADEIASQLQDSQASVVVSHPAVVPVVKEAMSSCSQAQHLICTHNTGAPGELNLPSLYKDDGQAYPQQVDLNPASDVVILPYSSGTTGKPKGVMLTHRNIVANLQQISAPEISVITDSEDELVFGVLPMFHIYGMVASFMFSFSAGATCVTFAKFDPQLYVGSLLKYKPTILYTVPPILNFLAHTPQVKPEFMTSVKHLVCGAAPVGETLAKQTTDKFNHGLHFQEGYGMTELSPVSHITPSGDYVPGSCGKPVSNTLAKIVDINTGETIGPEEGDGELCIKGPQVMKGYYNNVEATEATIDADGWLHTGDIARLDRNGHCFIVDRLKELIKVKGFQVAPAELEDLLRTFPGIADVAVIGVPDEKAGELPRAYIVKDPGNDGVTAQRIEEFVASKVSAHKQLAGGVVFIDCIPKSLTGKILRKDLKAQAVNQ